ncbi:endolytic transglycosylase MltG [Oscillatoria sp. FACHB-1407]|uniref:endolytic transglycosylase MltG n=1 Tax=Oscillatoria sp. FACHB-1407 TaxID=2692847 RepID=UPI001685EF11|nr:endolytic transglycosylase MltG [Oscillatoria sp. FACHB-1407]MBD2464619.1 endolytic transglycosylase MltG [Oscillatoria sp. FACHB-1407]
MSKWLFYLLVLPATLGLCGWQGWLWWSWASSPAVAASNSATATDQPIQIEIPEGTSAQQIGEDLEAAGIIQSADAWNLWTRWQSLRDRQGGFQAGTYELSPTEPLAAIANIVWQGNVVQQSFTIPEGWGMKEIAAYFEEQGFFAADAFLAATQQIPRDRYPWLPPDIVNLEGFLYPDTYQVAEISTPEAVINQMLDRFEQAALPIYEQNQANSPYTLLEWVTLASIVEREAVVGEERPLIASVFAKRLREGIPLGADPTVEYAFGIRQTPDQPLTFAQVNTPSPYNTYVNAGLPPGPISSPGLASLEVSLNPTDTEYLYFVARYDGTHVFSRTLAEHQAAQDQIHDNLEQQREAPANSVQ